MFTNNKALKTTMLTLGKTLTSPSLIRTIFRPLSTQIPDHPSAHHYDDLINAAGRDGDFPAVGQLLYKRWRDGFFNTKYTFNFISTDLSILDDLLQTLSRLDKGFVSKSAYDSLVARLSKLQRTDEALRVVEQMAAGNFGANAVTFHPILNVFTRKKKMEDAWRMMETMRNLGINPDVTAYNYILTAYCFQGDLASAAGVMTKIVEEGMEADSRTYDALVLGACRAGKVEGALVVLRRMVDEGLPALYSTHVHVIAALLKMGYCAQAVEFVLCYAGRDKALDTESFGILASRLIKLKKLDEAKLVLEEMSKRDLKMEQQLKDFYELHRCD